MIKNNNAKQAPKVVFSIAILASQLEQLLRFEGQPIRPFNNPKHSPMMVERDGQDKIRFSVGENSFATAVIPVDGDDLSLANGISYKMFEDGTATVGLIPRRNDVFHPIRRELGRTTIHAGSLKEMPELNPVHIRVGERVKYFANGKVNFDRSTELERTIAGAEWWIIYHYDQQADKVNIKDIIGFGDNYSDAAVAAFREEMTRFLRQPTKAFDHLSQPATKSATTKPITKREARAANVAKAARNNTATKPAAYPKKPAVENIAPEVIVAIRAKDGQTKKFSGTKGVSGENPILKHKPFAMALEGFVPASAKPAAATEETKTEKPAASPKKPTAKKPTGTTKPTKEKKAASPKKPTTPKKKAATTPAPAI